MTMSNENREQQIRSKAKELGQKYFPDEANIWARGNIEAEYVESACVEMAEWLDQHPHWIPIEERLPPIAYHDDLSENYLVVDSDGELLIAYYDAKNELWFSVDSNPRIYDVTHWMEIQPPRKEE